MPPEQKLIEKSESRLPKGLILASSAIAIWLIPIATEYKMLILLLLTVVIFRKKSLPIIYFIVLILSGMNAFGSIFLFDGSDMMHLRYGAFYSAIAIPLLLIIAGLLSKKSKWWFLLPLIPIASFVFFYGSLKNYIIESNTEYCQRMLQEFQNNPSPEAAHNLCK